MRTGRTAPKQEQGIEHNYHVKRVDGRDAPGEKHEKCFKFVLDVEHDPFAKKALAAYADACAKEFPLLAADIRAKIGGEAAQSEVYDPIRDEKKPMSVDEWRAQVRGAVDVYVEDALNLEARASKKNTFNEWMKNFAMFMSW
jgi:hypothetical protein